MLAGIGAAACAFALLITFLYAGQSRDVAYLPAVPLMLGLIILLVLIELLVVAGPDRDTGREPKPARRDDWVWRDPPQT